MAAIEAALRKSDPFGYAVHHLPPDLRLTYDRWRADCERVTSQHENPFAAMLNGHCYFPRLPPPVAAVIDSCLSKGTLRADCTERDARDAYNALLGEV
jgi:hypothetical protein